MSEFTEDMDEVIKKYGKKLELIAEEKAPNKKSKKNRRRNPRKR